MIGYLRGSIVDRGEEQIVLDVGGVGYELNCSLATLEALLDRDECEVWVQTQMREDALLLFGFATRLEKRMFNSLLKVNGVGPKMAIKILSGARLADLAQMIETGDVKGLSNLPKVGKKTAEQLILALKGKLVVDGQTATVRAPSSNPAIAARFTGARAQILSALVNLGFRLQDAESVVGGLPESTDVEQGVRDGLRALSGGF